MKMTFEFNEELQTITLKYDKFMMQVTETEDSWNRFFVITSGGLRKPFYSDYNFNEEREYHTERWLFKVAYEYFEMKRTRSEKLKAIAETELEEITD
jgi:hypothetical protein